MNMDAVRSIKSRIDSSFKNHVTFKGRRASTASTASSIQNDTTSSILNAQSHTFHPSVEGAKLISREDILNNREGFENNLVLLTLYNNEWVPVAPDFTKKLRSTGGIVASGFPLRIPQEEEEDSAARFRFEIPQHGNVTRVFLRFLKDSFLENPSYRQAPYLLFVNDCLCVRHVPAHAVVGVSSKAVLNKEGKTWERLELRAPFSSFYNSTMSSTEHEAAFLLCGGRHKPVKWDESKQCFVLQNRKNKKKALLEDSSTTSSSGASDSGRHHYDQKTWFALARLGGDQEKSIELTKVEEDTTVDNEKDNDSALEGTLKSTATSALDICWAQISFWFLLLLSKLGLMTEAQRQNKLDNEDSEVPDLSRATDEKQNYKEVSGQGEKHRSISDLTSDSTTEEEKKESTSSTTSSVAVSSDSPFEFCESIVTDKHTGEVLSPTTVVRGSVRCETLVFHVYSRLINLTRRVVTTKKVGFGFINVGMDSYELGTFEVGKQEHVLPPQEVPSTVLAKGVYKIHITYTADNVQDEVLREESVEFSIV